MSYEKNVEEIEKSNDKIEKITGNRTKLYRAPYGEYNNTVIKSAIDKGYYTIQWSLDTLDYTGLSGKEMWNRLDTKLSSGDIILMHNGTKHTADSLDMIINNINKTKIIAGPMPLHPHPLFINFPPFISLIIYYGKEIFLCMIF